MTRFFLLALTFITVFSTAPSASALSPALPELATCADSSAVYHLDHDTMTRHVFPNRHVFFSWHLDFSEVVNMSCEQLATYRFAGVVTYQEGMALVKMPSVNTVYYPEQGGILRPIESEYDARMWFGPAWSHYVDDMPESFFSAYTVEAPISTQLPPRGLAVRTEDNKIYRVNSQYTMVEQSHFMNDRQEAITRGASVYMDATRSMVRIEAEAIPPAARDAEYERWNILAEPRESYAFVELDQMIEGMEFIDEMITYGLEYIQDETIQEEMLVSLQEYYVDEEITQESVDELMTMLDAIVVEFRGILATLKDPELREGFGKNMDQLTEGMEETSAGFEAQAEEMEENPESVETYAQLIEAGYAIADELAQLQIELEAIARQ